MTPKRNEIIKKHLEMMAYNHNTYSQTDMERLSTDSHAYEFIDTACSKEAEEVRDFWKEYYEECKKGCRISEGQEMLKRGSLAEARRRNTQINYRGDRQ